MVEVAPALAALLTAALAAALAVMSTTSIDSGTLIAGLKPPFWMALAASGAGSVAHATALVFAPRYVRRGEANIVLLLETVVSPLLVFAFYAELPSAWTLCGGALLLITLVAHEMGGGTPPIEAKRSRASSFSWRAGAGGLSAMKLVDPEATAAGGNAAVTDDDWSTDSDERTPQLSLPQLSLPGGLRLPERLPSRAVPVGGRRGGGELAGTVEFYGVPYRAFSRESAPDGGGVARVTHSRSL